MENTGIPVNPSDLPTERVTLPDDRLWKGSLEKVTLALKLDKNDHMYVAVRCAIVQNEDYEGMMVERNYLALPIGVPPNASNKVKFYLQNHNQQFAIFAQSFKINKILPVIMDIRDNEARAKFAEFWEQFYGNVGTFSIENSEFPEGSGRITSKIKEFVI